MKESVLSLKEITTQQWTLVSLLSSTRKY